MKNKVIITINLIFGLLIGSQAVLAQQGQFKEGVHYFKIEQPPSQVVSETVEVTEAFSYACSHCNTFEPYMQSWDKNKPGYVKLTRLPVAFGRRAWELLARGYMTAEAMGIANESHEPMMDAIWKENKQFRSLDDLADFYAQFGVKQDIFIGTYNSFAVDSQMRKGQRDIGLYGVNGTPSMIVNRKYRVASNKDVPGFDAMLTVVNYLVEIEHAQ
jgi:thiol:disulfide interchange protein DsbA